MVSENLGGARNLGVTIACLFLLMAACSGPTLKVKRSSGGIELDLQTLGEYPTSARHITLREALSGEIVWEVVAKEENLPEIWTIPLRAGENPCRPEGVLNGDYDVVMPRAADHFVLEKGRRYRVEIWGRRYEVSSTVDFTLD